MIGKIFVLITIIFVIIALRALRKKRRPTDTVLPDNIEDLLQQRVVFYKKLDEAAQQQFAARVKEFIRETAITGVGVEVTVADKVLVAASAIIPIHHFPTWRYRNINEVLLYGTSFNKEYETEGNDRNVLGMVGDGAMNGQMILSLPSLRSGFAGADGHNTAIHEFVHLIDKADGSVDGIPEYLLEKPYIIPWVKQMRQEIGKMRTRDGDIDPYGATNEAEFFAVIAEYFFEKPQALKEKHPALYDMLEKMFLGHDDQ